MTALPFPRLDAQHAREDVGDLPTTQPLAEQTSYDTPQHTLGARRLHLGHFTSSILANESAFSASREHDALLFENAVGASDGIPIDDEVTGELTHGWQRRVGL